MKADQAQYTSLPIFDYFATTHVTSLVSKTNMNTDTICSKMAGNSYFHCQKLFDSLTMGVVFQDVDGLIVTANPAAQRILGLTLDQMRGVTSIDPRWLAVHEDGSLFPGQDHPAMVALRTQKPVLDVVMGVFNPRIEAQTWINVRAFPIIDDTREGVCGVYAMFEDITKLKLAHKNELESETRFQALFAAMSEGVALHQLVYDAHGNPSDYTLIDANPAFERQTGMQRAVVLGQLASQVYGSGEAPFLDLYAKTVLNHEPVKFEQYFAPLKRVFLVKAFSFEPDRFATVFEDITESKHTRAERDRLLKIVKEAPEYIGMINLEFRFVFINRAGLRLVGLPEDTDVSTLEIKDIRPSSEIKRVMSEIIPTALTQGFWQGETALMHRDGHEIPVYQVLFVQRDEFGNPQYLSTVIRDISQQKAYEIELTQAKETAETANLAKSRFLATMSHEIRTPMNGILGMAQLLLMSDFTEDERRGYARTILMSGQTLLTLLNDILDLSKVEADQLQLDSVVFDPASLVHETSELFVGAVHAKRLKLEYRWRGTPGCRFKADAYRVRQMLSNLIGNAIKFTKTGSIQIEGNESENNGDGDTVILEFSVRDTGIGIPPDKMDLLFKPFSQTDNSITREYGGSGLGLSIVRSLAQRMGGDVGVESVLGTGSRFWFSLRASRVSEDHESRCSDRKMQGAEQVSSALSGKRVLVVEDNAVNRMVIETILDRLGIHTTVAHDGQQAVDIIMNAERPDLVLMDVHMPIMDGYLATERIRQWEAANHRSRLPIIALTADAYEQDHQHCLNAGMDDYLTKPVVIDDLQRALARWL